MTGDARGRPARLPRVDTVVADPRLAALVEEHGRATVTDAVRDALEHARERVLAGGPPPDAGVVARRVAHELHDRARGGLREVLNATGVVLHTNLGRAPLSEAARAAVLDATGYTTLEYDLAAGTRGSRTAHVAGLAARLCGTAAATVVNNGAAALALVLAALAGGREVVVSRGELVEIGGSYRLPELMTASGAHLREVGTTNRTRLADYRAAIGPDTALLLKVHRSNFAMVGFTEEAQLAELTGLGAEMGVPVVHDLGSGLPRAVRDGPLAQEPAVARSVHDGADLVVFSGDKLLGGPQAGILAGHRDLVARCVAHPLARAVRIDKLQRAALEATLTAHLREDLPRDVPVVAMMQADPGRLRARAEQLAAALGDGAEVVASEGAVGGGALPGVRLPSWAVALDRPPVSRLVPRLREGDPPVVARVEADRVLLDLRTVPERDDARLAARVRAARG